MAPSPKFHEYVYGTVPPLTIEVKETDWPVVGDVGVNEKSTDKATGEMVSVVVAEPDPALLVAVTVIVKMSAKVYA